MSAELQGDGAMLLAWTRRSRLGWDWPAGTEVPIGESAERYQIEVQGSVGTLTFLASEPQIVVSASALSGMNGQVMIAVVQIGDFAESRPATTSILI